MRFIKSVIAGIVLSLGFFGIANAVTFDGTNPNPVYTEGITEVYAITDNGVEVYIPVWSMEACTQEDGHGQVACVWHAPTRGNMIGAMSFVKLGGNEFATISHEAARILLVENVNIPTTYVPTENVVTENVPTFSGELPYNSAAQNSWTMGFPPCQMEDSIGCYWDAEKMGNTYGTSFVVDYAGNYSYGKIAR